MVSVLNCRPSIIPRRCNAGFTLIELLVVIAILGILAAMLLPALARSKSQAKTIICISNMKQMSYAWIQYTMDHEDLLPPNSGYMGATLPPQTDIWVYGWLDNDDAINWTDNTNISFLKNSMLAPYLAQSVGIWHCPADLSSSAFDQQRHYRVRSYSMNGYLTQNSRGPTDRWRETKTLSDLRSPDPSQTFVFIDEREDSISDAIFAVDMENEPAGVASVPRSAHNSGGTIAFGDGHAIRNRWSDSRTCLPIEKHGFVGIIGSGRGLPNEDIIRLRDWTTGLKN